MQNNYKKIKSPQRLDAILTFKIYPIPLFSDSVTLH